MTAFSIQKKSNPHAEKILGENWQTQQKQQKIINSYSLIVCWCALEGLLNISCFFSKQDVWKFALDILMITTWIQQMGLKENIPGIVKLVKKVMRIIDSKHSQASIQTYQLLKLWQFHEAASFPKYWKWRTKQPHHAIYPVSEHISLVLCGFIRDTPAWQSKNRAGPMFYTKQGSFV